MLSFTKLALFLFTLFPLLLFAAPTANAAPGSSISRSRHRTDNPSSITLLTPRQEVGIPGKIPVKIDPSKPVPESPNGTRPPPPPPQQLPGPDAVTADNVHIGMKGAIVRFKALVAAKVGAGAKVRSGRW